MKYQDCDAMSPEDIEQEPSCSEETGQNSKHGNISRGEIKELWRFSIFVIGLQMI